MPLASYFSGLDAFLQSQIQLIPAGSDWLKPSTWSRNALTGRLSPLQYVTGLSQCFGFSWNEEIVLCEGGGAKQTRSVGDERREGQGVGERVGGGEGGGGDSNNSINSLHHQQQQQQQQQKQQQQQEHQSDTQNVLPPSSSSSSPVATTRIRCLRQSVTDSTLCEARNFRLVPARVTVSLGGEEIEDVLGREESVEFPEYDAGAWSGTCKLNMQFPPLPDDVQQKQKAKAAEKQGGAKEEVLTAGKEQRSIDMHAKEKEQGEKYEEEEEEEVMWHNQAPQYFAPSIGLRDDVYTAGVLRSYRRVASQRGLDCQER